MVNVGAEQGVGVWSTRMPIDLRAARPARGPSPGVITSSTFRYIWGPLEPPVDAIEIPTRVPFPPVSPEHALWVVPGRVTAVHAGSACVPPADSKKAPAEFIFVANAPSVLSA